jgi:hypothetical protein
MMSALDIHAIVRTLGGDLIGPDSANVPGPGHNPNDRSLSIRRVDRDSGQIIVFSHAGDDWQLCKDYIRERLGLAKWSDDRTQPRPCANVRWQCGDFDGDAAVEVIDGFMWVHLAGSRDRISIQKGFETLSSGAE